jgi:hypothetical protein
MDAIMVVMDRFDRIYVVGKEEGYLIDDIVEDKENGHRLKKIDEY